MKQCFDLIVASTQAFCKQLIEKWMLTERRNYLVQHPETKGNGYYCRDLATPLGFMARILVPRTRDSKFRSELIPNGKCTIDLKRLVSDLFQEGIGLRGISRVLETHFKTKLSPALLSDLARATEEEVELWRNRPLQSHYAAVHIDAFYFPVRRDSVAKEAVYVALGTTLGGQREILGYWLPGGSESACQWGRIFEELKHRGISKVDYVVADGLTGLNHQIVREFPGAKYQLCCLHAVRWCQLNVRVAHRKEITADMKMIYHSSTRKAAEDALVDFDSKWGKFYPSIVRFWRRNFVYVTACLDQAPAIQRNLYTNNCLEALHKQIKRRLKAMEQFVNEPSAMGILYRLFKARNEGHKQNSLNHWKALYTSSFEENYSDVING